MVSDYLSSTRLQVDQSGKLETYLYHAYGEPITKIIGEENNQKLFTGQKKLDPQLSIYNYKARFYSPYLGIFIQADVIQGPNRYAYAGANPINFNDPSGNEIVDSTEADNLNTYACDEMDWGCKTTVASTLGKLNGAMAYTQARGWNMSSKLIQHFLYGQGEDLDVSNLYARATERATGISDGNATGKYIYGSLRDNKYDDQTVKTSSTRNDIISMLCSNTSMKFSTSTVVYPNTRYKSEDIFNSLYRYTVNVSGDLVDGERRGDTWILKLQNPSVSIFDRYDWDENSTSEVGFDMADILPGSLVNKIASTNSNWGYRFLDFGIKLKDRDVAALMDPKVGIGIPFD
ncbi:MAG: RHS repeat-associated core domain-containing protein, partial [Candidatus Roizmanbacteria bacterium]